jgi:hypothetical protein
MAAIYILLPSYTNFPFSLAKRTHSPVPPSQDTEKRRALGPETFGGEAAHAPESGANDRRLPALLIAP